MLIFQCLYALEVSNQNLLAIEHSIGSFYPILPIPNLVILMIVNFHLYHETMKTKKPRTHHLTKYIKVLGKQNTCNIYAACLACIDKLGNEEALKYTFTN